MTLYHNSTLVSGSVAFKHRGFTISLSNVFKPGETRVFDQDGTDVTSKVLTRGSNAGPIPSAEAVVAAVDGINRLLA